ncbi:MAG: AAA family ATPase [Sphaerochaetaceae bacterium]|jgi:hypothetical protein|nr:AAA family ATPase [Sphaerochaetaceae bacterium]
MKVIDPTISSFESLIAGGNLYVDKTAYIYKLVTGPRMVFFSRPRRFGKSLTVSTLDALFRGKRNLFAGLAIDSLPYDWKVHPVIHIDFAGCHKKNASEVNSWLNGCLQGIAQGYSVSPQWNGSCDNNLASLIQALSAKGEVVVLIDEYDKVISDNIFNPEVEGIRDLLGGFYETIKFQNARIRFAFITGVTKYAKLSVFSKMNKPVRHKHGLRLCSDVRLLAGRA